MSSTSRPSLLRTLAQRKVLWLAVPAIAVLAVLVLIGTSAVSTPSRSPRPTRRRRRGRCAAAQRRRGHDRRAGALLPRSEAADRGDHQGYLVANPEIFLDVQNALEEKMEKEQAAKLKVAIADNAAEIYRAARRLGRRQRRTATSRWSSSSTTTAATANAASPTSTKLVETDPKVRVVFKELPILSKGSEEAAHVALAAKKQGKYWEIHKAMLGAKGHMDEASALRIAEKLGLDMDKLKADMASPEVKAEIEKDEALAKKMGVNGTPHFLIGDRAIPGAPEDLYQQLSNNVQELRKKGCSYC